MTQGAQLKIRFLLAALVASPAVAQDSMSLGDLLSATHIHGIAAGPDGSGSATLATHHGLWAIDLDAGTALRIGTSSDDFMGFTPVPGKAGHAFASGHPATGGNLGIIRTEDGGQTWTHVSDGLNGPVDFHNMEVSRTDPAVIYGIGHDGMIQHSNDSGATWQVTGAAPARLIDIATSDADAAALYAATEDGLFRSTDKGASWTALVEDRPVTTVDVGADGVLRAYGFGQGMFSVAEDGTTTALSDTPRDGYLLYLASLSGAPHRMMALSDDGQLLVSDDGGATWTDAVDR